jgi:SPOR domain
MGEMEELHAADDQSHYEISLTAGQAFAAFVLLLLSLAASFGFGLMIGKGQADERLVVQKETPVVTEATLAPKKTDGQIVELGVSDDEFQEPTETAEPAAAPVTETPAATETVAVIEDAATSVATETPAATPPAPPAQTPAVRGVTTYAQLLSTENKLTAEMLAAKLIDRGFNAAYVERGSSEKGPIYRVRVKFDSDAEARAAEPKLREFSKDVWITTK